MKRKVSHKRTQQGGVHHTAVIEDIPCNPGTIEYRQLQRELLKILYESPDLMAVGGFLFESMRMYHDGEKWKLELKAYEPPNKQNRYSLETPESE